MTSGERRADARRGAVLCAIGAVALAIVAIGCSGDGGSPAPAPAPAPAPEGERAIAGAPVDPVMSAKIDPRVEERAAAGEVQSVLVMLDGPTAEVDANRGDDDDDAS